MPIRSTPIAALAIFTASLALAGCAEPPPSLVKVDPSDPAAATPPVGYAPAIGAYLRHRPVEPKSWEEQNRRVTPPARER